MTQQQSSSSSTPPISGIESETPHSFSLGQMIHALWRFARPHTIYGTLVSSIGLYLLALPDWRSSLESWPLLVIGLGACLNMNIYIVGLNQLIDIEIDRINKPHLPLAAGDLTYRQGVGIVAVTGMLALVIACWQIPFLLGTVLCSGLIGTAYSLPPLRLKRFPITAAFCIFVVRGLIVNLGLYAYFRAALDQPVILTPGLLALTTFISFFGVVIAIFKDIPDMEGDRQFQISTFSLQLGPERVFNGSVAILIGGYLVMAGLGSLVLADAIPWIMVLIHSLGIGILLLVKQKTDIENRSSVVNYYQLIWKLFYLEYLLYPLAFMIK